MIEKGVVRSVDGEMATIEILPLSPESCESCGSCAEGPAGRVLEIRNTMDLYAGQRVELEVQGVGELGPAAVVFLLPVAAILLGAVIGNLVVAKYADLGISQTLGGILGSIAFLVPAILAVRWYDRAYSRKGAQVRIIRKGN